MKLSQSVKVSAGAVVLIWAVFILNWALPFELRNFGIRPLSWTGLWGLLFSPFLHLNLSHIMANTLPLFILLTLSLVYDLEATIFALIIIMAVGGGLVWLFGGSNTVHIGASGVIFGLIGFLLAAGIFLRDWKALLTAGAVFFLYGGILLSNFVPKQGVSWTGHLFGFLAGILAAWLTGVVKKAEME